MSVGELTTVVVVALAGAAGALVAALLLGRRLERARREHRRLRESATSMLCARRETLLRARLAFVELARGFRRDVGTLLRDPAASPIHPDEHFARAMAARAAAAVVLDDRALLIEIESAIGELLTSADLLARARGVKGVVERIAGLEAANARGQLALEAGVAAYRRATEALARDGAAIGAAVEGTDDAEDAGGWAQLESSVSWSA